MIYKIWPDCCDFIKPSCWDLHYEYSRSNFKALEIVKLANAIVCGIQLNYSIALYKFDSIHGRSILASFSLIPSLDNPIVANKLFTQMSGVMFIKTDVLWPILDLKVIPFANL